MKKIPETDAIFNNISQAKKTSENKLKTARISIDTKAKVKVGELSREGYDRHNSAPKALDHDYAPKAILVPFGILDIDKDQLWIYFGTSRETSDFIVDCLEIWWNENAENYKDLEELIIELDGGSACRSNRTQFIKRMVGFSQKTNLKIKLLYYPPYHSKYNPIERCWACLENFWNGTLLDSIETVIEWAKNMTWKGINPIVTLVQTTYLTGVKPSKQELELSQKLWFPSVELPSWDVTIIPTG